MKQIKSILFLVSLLCTGTSFAQVSMTLDATQRGPKISHYQYGLFFEEINHAGDGGLYAELIRNRSFEDGRTPVNWSAVGNSDLKIISSGLLNRVQYQALQATFPSASKKNPEGVANKGFWGMKFVKDSTYHLTLWAKAVKGKFTRKLTAQLQSSDHSVCGQTVISGKVGKNWTKLSVAIKATGNANKGRFVLLSSAKGILDMDVVSLFPYTWKNHPNGLRSDLAQLLADTHPRFLRFPGGCYVEGQGSYDNAFQWKKTIGRIEDRPGHLNLNWGYRVSDGLGFDEFLQLCEDMKAAPLFVVNVGLGHGYVIPLDQMDSLVTNTMDAIEYANGPVTSKWGAVRARNGHPAPYHLKFIEVGNENYQNVSKGSQSDDYPERYIKFYTAIKSKYPSIQIIGNVEAWGTDHPSWRNHYPVDLQDEHYYRSFNWMRDNYRKYDHYNRTIHVYNGEYAANSAGTYGKYGDMNSALGEAIYMLGMERNSEVCRMASFAPIFTNVHNLAWPYDMIHFDAARYFCTPSYYVQKLMPEYLGKQNLLWTETGNIEPDDQGSSQVGVGTWETQSSYRGFSVRTESQDALAAAESVRNVRSRRRIIPGKNSIRSSVEILPVDKNWTDPSGSWKVTDGVRKETANADKCLSINDQKINSRHYIYSLQARKDGGNEGFLVVFNYKDAKNYACWNVGGWRNTSNGIEICKDGATYTVSSSRGSVETGQWYRLKVDVNGDSIKCYLNGQLINSTVLPPEQLLYQSAQIDVPKGKVFLKVVNPDAQSHTLRMDFKNMNVIGGQVLCYDSKRGTDENTMDDPRHVVPGKTRTVNDVHQLVIPAFSLNFFTFQVKDIAPQAISSGQNSRKE